MGQRPKCKNETIQTIGKMGEIFYNLGEAKFRSNKRKD